MRLARFLLLWLVVLATSAVPCLGGRHLYQVTKYFYVPEYALYRYEHMAEALTGLLSNGRRPAFHLMAIRGAQWPVKRRNLVLLEVAIADSTCEKWPKDQREANCEARPNATIYTCKGLALVRNGLQLRRFVKKRCDKMSHRYVKQLLNISP
ncbi:uncharacterized protein LOC144133443 [Amblyomma americanum]